MSLRVLVLDNTPFSLLCEEANNDLTRRLSTYMDEMTRLGVRTVVPATVIGETARGDYAHGVHRVLNKGAIEVIELRTSHAFIVGKLLHRYDLKAEHFVDASVAAVAQDLSSGATLLTSDVADLEKLTSDAPTVTVKDVNKIGSQ